MSTNKQQYKLWKPSNTSVQTAAGNPRSKNDYLEEEADFFRLRNSRFDIQELIHCQQQPPRRYLVELINSTLVIGQEVSLTVILLAIHRDIVTYEAVITKNILQSNKKNVLEYLVANSPMTIALVYASMLIITYYNQKAFAADSKHGDSADTIDSPQNNRKRHKKGHRRRKAIVRLSDGVLLAIILRVISGLLKSLTASYSTDTVYALAITGMIVHLLACDYRFANGFEKEGNGGDTAALTRTQHHPRPKFLGGTVSLNAAFFATILLISRIKSNATSYAFVSSVVTLFAFYPTTRHEIARHFPNRLGFSPCFAITTALTAAAWLLLVSSAERFAFAGLQLLLLVLSPCLQWWLQRYKKRITGKWDIAHINVS